MERTSMKKQKEKLLLGIHASIEGGLYKALERASSVECTVVQFFTKSNRQWFAKSLTEKDIDQFKKTRKELKIDYTVTHASYLINLASPKEETRSRSIDALKKELNRCQALEVDYLVLHPGSHVGQGVEKGSQFIVDGLNEALSNHTGLPMLLLETMAGQGSSLGTTFEEIATLREQSKYKNKIGVCLDTCHVFASGYDLRDKDSYTEMWNTFEKVLGIENLKVIHVNDSKKELDSRVDRHENIGNGEIGKEAFALLFNDPRFFKIPKILETPKKTDLDDLVNIATIKQLLTEKTKKTLNLK